MNVIHDETRIWGFFNEYRFLSNFWYAAFEYGGLKFPTNEHFYQAMKVKDDAYREMVANASTPGKAKFLGSKKGLEKMNLTLRPDWEDIKINVMREGLIRKFSRPDMHQLLLDTGDRDLVELNNWGDQEWGMVEGDFGLSGKNLLGKALMDVRTVLKNNLTWVGESV